MPTPSLRDFATKAIRNYYQLHTGHMPLRHVHEMIMSEVEQPLIEETLEFANGDVAEAAKILGLSVSQLRDKMEVYAVK